MQNAERTTTDESPKVDPSHVSLRDYFAAAALQGLLTRPECLVTEEGDKRDRGEVVAEWAYSYADAMLKAREAP